jgi:iron complex outermembrane recepter protein
LNTITVFGSRVKDRNIFDSAVPIDVFASGEVKTALLSGELGQAFQALSPELIPHGAAPFHDYE